MLESARDQDYVPLVKVQTTDLAVGMYVQELDRPWSEIPFLFRGFSIRDSEEINILIKHCDFVYIKQQEGSAITPGYRDVAFPDDATLQRLTAIANAASGESTYPDTVAVEKELAVAREIHASSYSSLESMFSILCENGPIQVDAIRYIVSNIVDSVMRNPDAFFLLQKLGYNDNYCCTHAINNCAMATAFCRHLGFSREEIEHISLGALLLDFGVIRLPAYILEKPGPLSPAALKLVRHHIHFAMEMIERTQGIPQIARDMIMTHHERITGRGYPQGLQGDQIPLCGRIAAIVDCYDAMISKRPYQEAMTPTEAVHVLYKWRNVDFHEDLIEQFIQCLGAYPTGTVVELSSGQIGMIVSQNRVKRPYPRVQVILNSGGEHCKQPPVIDLWEYARQPGASTLEIKRPLDPRALGFNPADYCP